jgi:hypothetical protein
MESLIKAWDLKPQTDFASGREENEAYAAADPGKAYAVYFANGGALQLKTAPGAYRLRWIDANTGEWGANSRVTAGDAGVELTAPGSGHWVAVLVR